MRLYWARLRDKSLCALQSCHARGSTFGLVFTHVLELAKHRVRVQVLTILAHVRCRHSVHPLSDLRAASVGSHIRQAARAWVVGGGRVLVIVAVAEIVEVAGERPFRKACNSTLSALRCPSNSVSVKTKALPIRNHRHGPAKKLSRRKIIGLQQGCLQHWLF